MFGDDRRELKRMYRHLTWGVVKWRNMFTPFSMDYRFWAFNNGREKIELTEVYIFGVRVARWQL